MPPVTFYFDVHSPWSYLASVLIGPLARRHDARIEWRPLHLANLMDRIDGLRPLEQTPARVAWYEQDIADRMAQHGVPYDPHPDYPLRPSRALRSCVHAAERGCADAFVRAVMRGYWFEKRDISSLAVLQAMADEAGLGPRPIADIVSDGSCKAAVARNTDDAIARCRALCSTASCCSAATERTCSTSPLAAGPVDGVRSRYRVGRIAVGRIASGTLSST